jgi:hypothetical protein
MPTVLRHGPYRIYFYSHEPGEPPHVHVDRGDASAKFWLNSVELASNIGYSARELRVIEDVIASNRGRFLRAWHDYFGT